MTQQSCARMFRANYLFCVSALAQRVQPGQGFHRSPAHGGPQRQDDRPPGPEAPLGGQHGSLLLHEEPAPLHLPKPSQEGIVPLPEHQIRAVHALQPLHQVQQVAAGSGTGAARAQPALPAAIHRLSTELGPARKSFQKSSLQCRRAAPFGARALGEERPGSSLPSFRCPPARRKRNLVVAIAPCWVSSATGSHAGNGAALAGLELRASRNRQIKELQRRRRALSVAQELGCS